MNRIIEKKMLSNDVFKIKVESPLIAEKRQPGQFVILQLDDYAERIPLTIADANPSEGTITLICQVVGKSTRLLAKVQKGNQIANILGPLGKPANIENFGMVVCVGSGIGIATLYPIAQAMVNADNKAGVIIGAPPGELLILENEIKAFTDELVICTDDGSYGRKCPVTEPLKELCESTPKPDLVVAIGSPIMMKICSEITRPFGIKTVVFLKTIVIDGIGRCGGCRVIVGGKTRFVCVEGPLFDGHQVDFDNIIMRLNMYPD